jgi:hypothetical protein
MNKNKKVALCNNDTIVKIFEEKLIPFGATKEGETLNLNKWINERRIPENRSNYNLLSEEIQKLGNSFNTLHLENYSLSLTDNYWIYKLKYPYIAILLMQKFNMFDKKIPQYQDINYFDNPISSGFSEKIIYKQNITANDLKVPDATTNGKNIKYWVERNNKKYLVKQNDAIYNYVAEKELLSSFVAYLINECRLDGKKKIIDLAVYQYEKGQTELENCCFSEIFTSTETDLVSYQMLTSKLNFENKTKQMEHIIKEYSQDINGIKDYFDFIILLDFLTESHRNETDIGLLYNNQYCRFTKPAPIYGGCNAFDYMIKDFTRASRQIYSSNHKNVFGMNEREQCLYIAQNIKWFLPEVMFRKTDTLLEYLSSEDMSAMPLQYKDNIADWLKYKLVLIANERRQMAIQEEMEKDEKTEKYESDE